MSHASHRSTHEAHSSSRRVERHVAYTNRDLAVAFGKLARFTYRLRWLRRSHPISSYGSPRPIARGEARASGVIDHVDEQLRQFHAALRSMDVGHR